MQLALADQGGDRQGAVDASSPGIDVQDALASPGEFQNGLDDVFFPVIHVADDQAVSLTGVLNSTRIPATRQRLLALWRDGAHSCPTPCAGPSPEPGLGANRAPRKIPIEKTRQGIVDLTVEAQHLALNALAKISRLFHGNTLKIPKNGRAVALNPFPHE